MLNATTWTLVLRWRRNTRTLREKILILQFNLTKMVFLNWVTTSLVSRSSPSPQTNNSNLASEQNNPLLNEPSPLARAKEVLAANGSLSEASLLLEAAIQKNDLGVGGYEAWILLGETHSMDEREEAAIRALHTGI